MVFNNLFLVATFLCSCINTSFILFKLGEAYHNILEEVFSKHFFEKLHSVYDLLVNTMILWVKHNEKGVDVSSQLESENHVCNMCWITIVTVTNSWSVYDYDRLFSLLVFPIIENANSFLRLWLYCGWFFEITLDKHWVGCATLASPCYSNKTNGSILFSKFLFR